VAPRRERTGKKTPAHSRRYDASCQWAEKNGTSARNESRCSRSSRTAGRYRRRRLRLLSCAAGIRGRVRGRIRCRISIGIRSGSRDRCRSRVRLLAHGKHWVADKHRVPRPSAFAIRLRRTGGGRGYDSRLKPTPNLRINPDPKKEKLAQRRTAAKKEADKPKRGENPRATRMRFEKKASRLDSHCSSWRLCVLARELFSD